MAFPSSLVLACGGLVLFAFVWAAWVSRREDEHRAGARFLLMALVLPSPFFLAAFLPGPSGSFLSWLLLGATLILLLAIFVPLRGGLPMGWRTPSPGVDERDIMFSRAALEPGTDRFKAYYASRPQNRPNDDAFRREPGLLGRNSSQYHPQAFAAADAAFWTIERLRPFVEGGGDHSAAGYGSGMPHSFGAGGGSGAGKGSSAGDGSGAEDGPTSEGGFVVGGASVEPVDRALAATRFLKSWAMKLGAHSVGVCELRNYHLYSFVGRGPEYGEPVELDHGFALALTVEMDKEMVDRAPKSPTVMESALQYLGSGVMAIQLADTIRRLGYRARAHIDGNYRVICPLVARDAGLGEIGRMGLLMTPRLGPRVRIAVVTTDLPLVPDSTSSDPTVIDFCARCRKCAECCPSRAISFLDPEEDEGGVLRWRIDSEACFGLWAKLGTDCARCMAVCPYSHPDNALHGLVRFGIRNNLLFRRGAVWMDDVVYGRHPVTRDLPDWLDGSEAWSGAE